MPDATRQSQLSTLVDRLLTVAENATEGLSVEQLNDTQGDRTNSMGFDIWHIVRTVDNVIHFVFEREKPVWMEGNYDERWNLPKVDQGTAMDPKEAYNLAFPSGAELNEYTAAVRKAVVPRIAAMSDEYLGETVKIVPFGEMPRVQVIGQVLISHGNGHLGRVDHARALLGKEGLGF